LLLLFTAVVVVVVVVVVFIGSGGKWKPKKGLRTFEGIADYPVRFFLQQSITEPVFSSLVHEQDRLF